MIAEIVGLFQALAGIDGLVPALPQGTYYTTNMDAMGLAQTELAAAGYEFTDCVMDEGHYYRMRFKPAGSTQSEALDLCYFAIGTSVPSLALMYRDGHGALKQFTQAGRVTANTEFASASMMLTAFRNNRSLAGLKSFWMPVFDGSPLALVR